MSVDILGTNCDQRVCMVQCCFTSTETIRLIRDGEPRTATSTFTQLLSSDRAVQVQCCFTSPETIRLIRDGEPRTATSTFSQLLSTVRCPFFSVASRPQRPYGLLWTGSPGRPPRLLHSPTTWHASHVYRRAALGPLPCQLS